METRILVPIDHSEIAGELILLAEEWGQQTGAELYFLHVTPMPPYTTYPSENRDDQLDDQQFLMREKNLEQLRQILQSHEVQSPYQILHRFGAPYWEIIATEKQINPDFILMGCHTDSLMQRLFLGSNTEYVVHHSKSSVYVFKSTKVVANHILVPVDFTKINQPVARLADQWALRTQADLHFIHVAPNTNSAPDVLHAFVDKLALSSDFKIVWRVGKPSRQILEYQKELQPRLTMMAAHSHTLMERWFAGSNTRYLLHHSKFPLFLYKK